jgi:hypothetical protein
LPECLDALAERIGLLGPASRPVQLGQLLAGGGDGGMLGAKLLFADGERALEERLSFVAEAGACGPRSYSSIGGQRSVVLRACLSIRAANIAEPMLPPETLLMANMCWANLGQASCKPDRNVSAWVAA